LLYVVHRTLTAHRLMTYYQRYYQHIGEHCQVCVNDAKPDCRAESWDTWSVDMRARWYSDEHFPVSACFQSDKSCSG